MPSVILLRMSSESQPIAKRRKLSQNADRISIPLYGAGRIWKDAFAEELRGNLIAIGQRMFRFSGRFDRDEPDLSDLIEASDDKGKTWYEYSKITFDKHHFTVLPVYSKQATLVYFIGWRELFVDGSWQESYEVWVSKDELLTFELVCNDAGFNHILSCFACEAEGVLYYYQHGYDARYCRLWKSKDMGKTWTTSWDNQGYDSKKPILISMASQRGLLFGITCKRFPSVSYHLLSSEDGGDNWKKADCRVEPRLLLQDPIFDRLLCFSATDCFELRGDSKEWLKSNAFWRNQLYGFDDVAIKTVRPEKGCIFGDGSILIAAVSRNYVSGYALSCPDNERASRHKIMLAMYLGRRGIDSALFRDAIAPFLFPY